VPVGAMAGAGGCGVGGGFGGALAQDASSRIARTQRARSMCESVRWVEDKLFGVGFMRGEVGL